MILKSLIDLDVWVNKLAKFRINILEKFVKLMCKVVLTIWNVMENNKYSEER